MWSDNETAVDFLGFQHLVAGVVDIVRSDHLLPATIGVFGDWGSGKSSLLRMAGETIAQDSSAVVLTFNGWLFEGYEDAKIALMGTILDEIKKRRTIAGKAKYLFERQVKRLNLFRVLTPIFKYGLAFALGGPAGVGIAAAADGATLAAQAASKVREIDSDDVRGLFAEGGGEQLRTAVREFRTDFQALLEETKVERLVVIVDDLDRCLPDTIIETLEAIKLFLFAPRTAFIIGTDERLVKYAVRRRFPEIQGERAEVGRDYLEKLIQFPVHIPPLDACELETYIGLLFAQAAAVPEHQFEAARTRALQCDASSLMSVRFNLGIAAELFAPIPAGLEENLSLAERIAPILAAGLSGNPRQCKRFLNTLLMRMAMAQSRNLQMSQRLLAKLMLLEYFKPEWFKKLAELQAAEAGRPHALTVLERAVRATPDHLESDAPEQEQDNGRKTTGRGTRRAAEAASGSQDAGASELGDLASWITDDWMADWLASAPPLTGEDLRPYFFFSRDTLGPLGAPVRRMTPRAQETLHKLLDESEAQQQLVLKDAPSLSAADAAAVFEALGAKASQDEDLTGDGSVLTRMLGWVQARAELRGQLLSLLGRLPVGRLPLALPMRIVGIMRGTETEPALKQLLGRWKDSTSNPAFAKAAAQALSRVGT